MKLQTILLIPTLCALTGCAVLKSDVRARDTKLRAVYRLGKNDIPVSIEGTRIDVQPRRSHESLIYPDGVTGIEYRINDTKVQIAPYGRYRVFQRGCRVTDATTVSNAVYLGDQILDRLLERSERLRNEANENLRLK